MTFAVASRHCGTGFVQVVASSSTPDLEYARRHAKRLNQRDRRSREPWAFWFYHFACEVNERGEYVREVLP